MNNKNRLGIHSQLAITYSNLTVKPLETGVKYVQSKQ